MTVAMRDFIAMPIISSRVRHGLLLVVIKLVTRLQPLTGHVNTLFRLLGQFRFLLGALQKVDDSKFERKCTKNLQVFHKMKLFNISNFRCMEFRRDIIYVGSW